MTKVNLRIIIECIHISDFVCWLWKPKAEKQFVCICVNAKGETPDMQNKLIISFILTGNQSCGQIIISIFDGIKDTISHFINLGKNVSNQWSQWGLSIKFWDYYPKIHSQISEINLRSSEDQFSKIWDHLSEIFLINQMKRIQICSTKKKTDLKVWDIGNLIRTLAKTCEYKLIKAYLSVSIMKCTQPISTDDRSNAFWVNNAIN